MVGRYRGPPLPPAPRGCIQQVQGGGGFSEEVPCERVRSSPADGMAGTDGRCEAARFTDSAPGLEELLNAQQGSLLAIGAGTGHSKGARDWGTSSL